MNSKKAFAAAAIALFGSSAAFAQSSEIDLQHFGAQQSSTVTRAEVRSEVQRAQAAGDLTTPSEVTANAVPNGRNATFASRADVRRELARADKTTPSEVTASAVPQAASKTRDAVRAEARAQARVDIYQDKARIGAGY